VGARFDDFLQRLRGGDDRDKGRLAALLGLNRELAKASDRRQLLLLLVDEAVRLFGAERGFLVVPRGAAFAVEVARNLDREHVQNPERKLSSTIVNKALGGAGVYSEDAQVGDLGSAQSIADLKLRSVLCMPLSCAQQVLGCIYLDHRFHSKVFADSDLTWLQAFADQGAIVLHLFSLLAAVEEQQQQLEAQNRALAATVASQAEALQEVGPLPTRSSLRHPFAAIVGDSPALLAALHVLDRVVDADFPVLIAGESGTGKELAARALHDEGPRRRGPFVAVNVAAIAPSLLESELFGHVQGAFTGASRDRLGLLREAQGGTLFLDEFTEMDLDLQAKLLRVLEERQVRPVGSDRSVPIDARIVAASNRDPQAAVAAGRLRQDLYFRLAVVTVQLPPLRQRLADLDALARAFLAAIAAEQRAAPKELPAELLAQLRRRAWPGNLRELKNEMQRLWALSGDGPLQAAMLSKAPGADAAADGGALPPFDLAAVEQWAVQRALAAAGGNKAEAARLLGISRRTLYTRLDEREPPATD